MTQATQAKDAGSCSTENKGKAGMEKGAGSCSTQGGKAGTCNTK